MFVIPRGRSGRAARGRASRSRGASVRSGAPANRHRCWPKRWPTRDFAAGLLELMAGGKKIRQLDRVAGRASRHRPGKRNARGGIGVGIGRNHEGRAANLTPMPLPADQSNSCVVYGERLFLKLFRKLVPGINPELEIGQFLAANGVVSACAGFVRFVGISAVAIRRRIAHLGRAPTIHARQIGLAGDVGRIWRPISNASPQLPPEDRPRPASGVGADVAESRLAKPPASKADSGGSLWSMGLRQPVAAAEPLAGEDLRKIALLGRRTAELHLALASDSEQAALRSRAVYRKASAIAALVDARSGLAHF